MTDEASGGRERLHSNWQAAGEPCERLLVDAAASFITELSDSQGEKVLVHQDLHGDNVIASERAPWLAIDPKPLIGEREYSLSPVIRSFEFGNTEKSLNFRLDRLYSELGLDRERVRGWAVAQSVAWSFNSSYADQHYQTARWLLAAGRHPR